MDALHPNLLSQTETDIWKISAPSNFVSAIEVQCVVGIAAAEQAIENSGGCRRPISLPRCSSWPAGHKLLKLVNESSASCLASTFAWLPRKALIGNSRC